MPEPADLNSGDCQLIDAILELDETKFIVCYITFFL